MRALLIFVFDDVITDSEAPANQVRVSHQEWRRQQARAGAQNVVARFTEAAEIVRRHPAATL